MKRFLLAFLPLLGAVFPAPSLSDESNFTTHNIIISTGGPDRVLLMLKANYAGNAHELGGPFELDFTVSSENYSLAGMRLSLHDQIFDYDVSELPSMSLVDISTIFFGISELKSIEPGFWEIRFAMPFGEERKD